MMTTLLKQNGLLNVMPTTLWLLSLHDCLRNCWLKGSNAIVPFVGAVCLIPVPNLHHKPSCHLRTSVTAGQTKVFCAAFIFYHWMIEAHSCTKQTIPSMQGCLQNGQSGGSVVYATDNLATSPSPVWHDNQSNINVHCCYRCTQSREKLSWLNWKVVVGMYIELL